MGMEQATAGRQMECPKCKGAAPLMTPMKVVAERNAVYGCKACGYTFTADGGAYVESTAELRDHFRGATLGQQTLTEMMAGERLTPATRALFQAQLIAYGIQMWNDGLKQGLLLGATAAEHTNKESARG